MEIFQLERRKQASWGTFFPESITKERETWGQTLAGTDGCWLKYRLVMGDMAAYRKHIEGIARQWSMQRKKFPFIDTLKMFEGAAQLRPTSLEYYDYTGRIETISRESILYQWQTGRRAALDRDKGVGFRGIVVRTEEPWGMESWAMQELNRFRIRALNVGSTFKDTGLTSAQPWLLRDSAEYQLRELLGLAWTEYATEPTPEKLNAVIGVESVIYRYILDTMKWGQDGGLWETMSPIPFPDRATAIRLWEQDKIDHLQYDQTEPWYFESEARARQEVTAIRRAYLTTGRVNITITPNPMLHTVSHPTLPILHNKITYGLPKDVQDAVGNPEETGGSGFGRRPFVREGTKQAGWNGLNLSPVPAWKSIQAEGPMPEPKLSLFTREISIPKDVAERLEAAITADKPVLVNERLNEGIAPILVLPRMFFNVLIVPLFDGGRTLKPSHQGSVASGWAIDGTKDGSETDQIFAETPFGFLETPISGRAIREGAIQEILPYA